MACLCPRTLRHALPRRLGHAGCRPTTDRRGLDRDRRRHCGDHLGGEGIAAGPLGVPRRGRRLGGRARNRAQSPAAEDRPMTRSSAAVVAAFWQRIPKPVLFGAVALLQLALLALMVADRVQILRDGTEVTLQSRPLDPRDFLRGDYVTLGYDISQLPAGALSGQPASGRSPLVFVKLAPNSDGVYQAVSVHAEPVAVTSPEVLIRGRVVYGAT